MATDTNAHVFAELLIEIRNARRRYINNNKAEPAEGTLNATLTTAVDAFHDGIEARGWGSNVEVMDVLDDLHARGSVSPASSVPSVSWPASDEVWNEDYEIQEVVEEDLAGQDEMEMEVEDEQMKEAVEEEMEETDVEMGEGEVEEAAADGAWSQTTAVGAEFVLTIRPKAMRTLVP